MATTPPNQNKLIITGKGKQGTISGTDARIIEQWANAHHLIAGTNITIDNPDAVNPTINATGGGGGTSVGYFDMLAGPDENGVELHLFFMGMGGGDSGDALGLLESLIPMFSNATGSDVWVSFGSGWMTKAGVGESVNVLPQFTAPAFTGGPIDIGVEIAAGNATFSNYAIFAGNPVSYTTGETYQFQTTDFTVQGNAGADLSFVNGSGQSGNGIISAAGGVYWAGITGAFQIPTGTTFT